ncbi:hypothetical protein FQN54_009528 [Arachnomyces sp. PD_36]|nr:hypothetical protein FQN54_009528 [Arachnomyces sp. PD_36]
MTGAKRPPSPSARISPPPVKRKAQSSSTTSQAAVSAFFTPASQKKPEKVTWRTVKNSLLVGKYSSDQTNNLGDGLKRRVAAFDLDSTLISTASKNTFARNADDWKWWHAKVPGRVKELNSEGYQVILISNQKKVALQTALKNGKGDSKSLSTFKEKTTNIMRQLDIPLSIYAATQYDEFRKPRPGMWKEMLDEYDLDVEGRLDLPGSFFVGDAAGRPGDHSCTDRDFAANIGITFKTPEEFFLDKTAPAFEREFDPTSYIQDTPPDANGNDLLSFVRPAAEFSKLNPQDLVIFCGSPGSGKSTYYWKYLEPLKYERVNQDTLKSVNNTNASIETRSIWTELAKEFKIPIRCIYFTASQKLCKHNDAVRASNPKMNPESRTPLPGIAFADFGKRFQEPKVEEGFQDVVRVDFRFQGSSGNGDDGESGGEEEKKRMWSQFYV